MKKQNFYGLFFFALSLMSVGAAAQEISASGTRPASIEISKAASSSIDCIVDIAYQAFQEMGIKGLGITKVAHYLTTDDYTLDLLLSGGRTAFVGKVWAETKHKSYGHWTCRGLKVSVTIGQTNYFWLPSRVSSAPADQ